MARVQSLVAAKVSAIEVIEVIIENAVSMGVNVFLYVLHLCVHMPTLDRASMAASS